jgi:hypothetical protein
VIVAEVGHLYCPLGLLLIDDFTGDAPLGQVEGRLDISDGAGGWLATRRRSVRTSSGVLAYPGLERRADPTGVAPVRYRARVHAELYRPLYPPKIGGGLAGGVEFDAPAWSEATPPAPMTTAPRTLVLLPASSYPFPSHVRVLHGRVLRAGQGVEDVLVGYSTTERVLTDRRGAFSLPLRWPLPSAAIAIDATPPSGPGVSVNATLPGALASSLTITL